jgi:hypothetical protein
LRARKRQGRSRIGDVSDRAVQGQQDVALPLVAHQALHPNLREAFLKPQRGAARAELEQALPGQVERLQKVDEGPG